MSSREDAGLTGLPEVRSKVRHLAQHIRKDGMVSPLCAVKPRALNLHVATWVLQAEHVTCRKCLTIIRERGITSSLEGPL